MAIKYKYDVELTVAPHDAASTWGNALITVYKGSGTNSGSEGAANIYLNNHSENWPYDITFTNANGDRIPFWMQESTSSSAKYWIKIPTEAGTQELHMSYGNKNAPNLSNGNDTFEFFDDFSGKSLDFTNKWYDDFGGDSASIDKNEHCLYVPGGGNRFVLASQWSPSHPIRIYTRVKFASALAHGAGWGLYGDYDSLYEKWGEWSTTYYAVFEVICEIEPELYDIAARNGGEETCSGYCLYGEDPLSWQSYRMSFDPGHKISVHNSEEWPLKSSLSVPDLTPDIYVGFRSGEDAYAGMYVKYICTVNELDWEADISPSTETERGAEWVYDYRTRIPVNYTSAGPQTNYPMKITLVQGTGSNSPGTIYLQNKCNNWPYDINFTNSAGDSVPFWCEEFDETDGTFWVAVDTPESGTADYYVIFGSSDAEDLSNGWQTFDVFDDFSEDFIGYYSSNKLSNWVWYNSKSGTDVDISSGTLILTGASDAYQANLIATRACTLVSNSIGKRVRERVQFNSTTAAYMRPMAFNNEKTSTTNQVFWRSTGTANQVTLFSKKDGNSSSVNATLDDITTYHLYDTLWYSGNAKLYQDGTEKAVLTTNIPTVNMNITAAEGSSGFVNIDWVFAGKYVSPEPTWATPTGLLYSFFEFDTITFGDSLTSTGRTCHLRSLNLAFVTLAEAIDQLAAAGYADYYIDPNKQMHFFASGTKSTGITLHDADIKSIKANADIMGVKNRIWAIGGKIFSAGPHKDAGISESESNYKRSWAQAFTAEHNHYDQVGLYLEAFYACDSLNLHIYGSDGSGEIATSNELAKASISPGAAGEGLNLILFDCSFDCIPGSKYWIVVDWTTAIFTKFWKLYLDDASENNRAYKTYEGDTWIYETSVPNIGYTLKYGMNIISSVEDTDSISEYGLREGIIEEAAIIEYNDLVKLAQAELNAKTSLSEEITLETQYDSDMQVGETITLDLSNIAISGTYIINNINIRVNSRYPQLLFCDLTLHKAVTALEDRIRWLLIAANREKTYREEYTIFEGLSENSDSMNDLSESWEMTVV